MIFPELYRSREQDKIKSLEGYYKPPAEFKHGEETLVASIPALHPDGQAVNVFEVRGPARFFVLEVLENQYNKGFVLSTGSGQDELIGRLAMAIANGMIGLRSERA